MAPILDLDVVNLTVQAESKWPIILPAVIDSLTGAKTHVARDNTWLAVPLTNMMMTTAMACEADEECATSEMPLWGEIVVVFILAAILALLGFMLCSCIVDKYRRKRHMARLQRPQNNGADVEMGQEGEPTHEVAATDTTNHQTKKGVIARISAMFRIMVASVAAVGCSWPIWRRGKQSKLEIDAVSMAAEKSHSIKQEECLHEVANFDHNSNEAQQEIMDSHVVPPASAVLKHDQDLHREKVGSDALLPPYRVSSMYGKRAW